MKTTRLLGSSLLILALLALSFPAWGQGGGKLTRIRMGLPSRSVNFFPLMVAQRQGFFKTEGLDVQLIIMRPSLSLQALVAGDVDFIGVPSLAILAAMTGVPVRNVFALSKGPSHTLIVKPEIRTMEDLKGKTLGVPGPKNLIDVATRMALKKHGLVPDKDVTIMSVGVPHIRFVALRAGRIDGSFLAPPRNKMLLKAGFNQLVRLTDLMQALTSGLAANTRKIRNNPDSIVRTIRATLRGTHFLKENKGEFILLLAREAGIKDKKMADVLYNETIDFYSYTGTVPDAVVKGSIVIGKNTQGITREVPVSEVVDWSMAQKAYKGLKK